jgi:hypothetical protein
MSQLTRYKNGIAVTWADGYLPPRGELIRNIKKYPTKRPEFNTSLLSFEPEDEWPRERIFESAAALMTSDFHGCNSQKVYSPPCSVWIAKINNIDNCPLKNFMAEAEYDTRIQDYFYFLGVHGDDEAELCMANLLNSLGFEKKLRNTYKNFDVFFEECEYLIHKILEVYTKPYLVAHTILHDHGFDTVRYTR